MDKRLEAGEPGLKQHAPVVEKATKLSPLSVTKKANGPPKFVPFVCQSLRFKVSVESTLTLLGPSNTPARGGQGT